MLPNILNNCYQLISQLALILLVCACTQQDSPIRNDVLIYCSEASPETFNPQLSISGITLDATSKIIYDQLVAFNPDDLTIQPSLAKSWTVSDNGRVYTFKLRKNVKFHSSAFFIPSRNFNADDVLFSFKRQWIRTHPFHQVSRNDKYYYFESTGLAKLFKNIKKIDDYTVQFVLHKAESPFLSTLAMGFASILSAEYADQLLASNTLKLIDSHPIGTGPYRLTNYQQDVLIRYQAHQQYWQQQPKIKHLVFAITPDASLRFARVVAGECDVVKNVLPIHFVSSQKFSAITAINRQGLNTAYLMFNTKLAPFDSIEVRQAINHAINKQAIIQAVYKNMAIPAISVTPPQMWSHDPKLMDYDYDPQKALELLEKAGYPDGFNMSISVMLEQRPYNPDAKKMAELIQQNLKAININLKIITYEQHTLFNKLERGAYQTALSGWIADNDDPDNFFYNLLSCEAALGGGNNSFWCEQQFNQLISQAKKQMLLDERKKLYKSAQKIFKQQAPWVPIAHAEQAFIIRENLKDLHISNLLDIDFKSAYFEDPLTLENSDD